MANTAILDSLELHDQSFIMRGVGTIDMPSRNADFTVIAARPRIWPAVPVINELLEGTVRELVEVHGTGPLSDLKFEARTLRSVQAALQVLSTRRPRPAPRITRPAESTWNTRQ